MGSINGRLILFIAKIDILAKTKEEFIKSIETAKSRNMYFQSAIGKIYQPKR